MNVAAVCAPTVRELLAAGADRLRGGVSPQLDARLLLTHVLSCDAAALLAHGDRHPSPLAAERFEKLIAGRAKGIPVAYLTGEAGFYGRRFSVTNAVLVPRPETEHVVERAIEAVLSLGACAVADIGTGSGVIACTIAAECPNARVYGSDRDGRAVALARRNAAAHRVTERCTFVQGDLGAALAPQRFDCIVANLPYVPTAELPVLPDPAAYEPRAALDGGPDGLILYRRLIAALPTLLHDGAWVFFEAGPGTLQRLRSLLEASLPCSEMFVEADYAGLERFLRARIVRTA